MRGNNLRRIIVFDGNMTRIVHAVVLTFALSSPLSAAAVETPALHVALVGDSLAHGAGDESGKGIAGRLEPELRQRGISAVSTANLARTGSTTRDLVTTLTQSATRNEIARANAIILSVGANDVRRLLASDADLESVVTLVEEVLHNIDAIVAELHRINPNARIVLLGAYAPIPAEDAALFLEPLVAMWDATLEERFADDRRVSVVRLSDIVDRPERLSTIDSFHPGGEAYQVASQRIAELLTSKSQVAEQRLAPRP